jgi:conjugal transfer mating pair stabilization protein TraG
MFEIYAYGNVDTLTGVFNAIAAIMGGDGYYGLIKTVAITGVLVSAAAGLFTPGRFHGWGWFMGFLLVYHAMFLPKADVAIVDKLGSQPPAVVGNVPIGVVFFGHATSLVGDVMTRFFETAFQVIPDTKAQLPEALAYQKNGVMFGNRLIQASRAANVADPQLRADMIAFVHNCTVYDLQDGTIDPAAFAQSTDIWALMGTPNPGRFSTWGLPVQVDTCPNVYTRLNARLPAEVARARATLALQMNPTLDPTVAAGVIDGQLEQAYTKTRIANAAQGAADLLRQNILINLVQDTNTLAGLRLNDPAATMLATARANATASTNASFITMGRIAAQALPMIRNVIEAVIYAVFPFVLLLFLLAQGKGLALAIKSFVMSLVWIQLWPPLYAILNYVGTLASAKNLAAAASLGTNTRGLALDTAASIYQGAISDQAIAGYLVAAIPVIATAIIKGGEVAFQAVTASSAIQSAASSEAAATSKGLISQNSVSLDQQQLGPTRTSAFMTTSTEAHGTTIQGFGPEAGVFRYQATMSRLASTFTISERQATAIGESARQAETFATSEREALQRSQATALTRALSIQESFEKSTQRSGGSMIGDGGSTSTQFQTLNSIAKDVNRRLGLSDDSVVGKSVAASASVGASIPLTEIGAQAKTEGRKLDQQALQSAYDYARRSAESAQITEARSLVREFRSSDAFQWARSSRTASAESFESSSRDATERHATTERAYAEARELARTAQFMREWSSGTQTDFTNYAAQRLAERGLLREEDPVRLQRAVTEIALSYARGGQSATGYVAPESPLGPSAVPAQAVGWTDNDLHTDYQRGKMSTSTAQIEAETRQHDGNVRQRQEQTRTSVGTATTDDLQSRVGAERNAGQHSVQRGSAQVRDTSRAQSQEYQGAVRIGSISENHGGTPAVWATVGANAAQPDLGERPAPAALANSPSNAPRDSTAPPQPRVGSGTRPTRPDPDPARRQQPRR